MDQLLAQLADLLAERLAPLIGTPDELVPIDGCGLEKRTAMRLIRTGELPGRKIGRRWYTRRSDLLRLVDEPQDEPASDVISLADRAARRRAQ